MGRDRQYAQVRKMRDRIAAAVSLEDFRLVCCPDNLLNESSGANYSSVKA